MGQKLTVKEQMRRNSRAVKKAIREVEREHKALERAQKKLVTDIKKLAKQGQMNAVKIMAKDLVRNKRFCTKMLEMRSQLWGVQQRMSEMKSTQAMTSAMQNAATAMVRMNKQMNLPAMQRIMKQFAMESEKMEMTQEMMGDAMDDAMGDDEDEEETDAIVEQVLAEIGLDMTGNIEAAPSTSLQTSEPATKEPEEDAAVSELEARLDNLRR
jgi:charged multivesicular body protein 2A